MFHLKDTDLFLKVRKPIAVNDREETAMELARKIKRCRLSNEPAPFSPLWSCVFVSYPAIKRLDYTVMNGHRIVKAYFPKYLQYAALL